MKGKNYLNIEHWNNWTQGAQSHSKGRRDSNLLLIVCIACPATWLPHHQRDVEYSKAARKSWQRAVVHNMPHCQFCSTTTARCLSTANVFDVRWVQQTPWFRGPYSKKTPWAFSRGFTVYSRWRRPLRVDISSDFKQRLHREPKNTRYSCPQLHQVLVDFKNTFTCMLSTDFALPCEM